jgi:hypothetical protein
MGCKERKTARSAGRVAKRRAKPSLNLERSRASKVSRSSAAKAKSSGSRPAAKVRNVSRVKRVSRSKVRPSQAKLSQAKTQPSQTQSGQTQPSQTQPSQTQSGQAPQQGQTTQQGQAGQAGGSANLTTEQRTRVRQTVLTGSNVPRVNNVNFALSVGTTVPTRVRVVAVPPPLIEIYPAWRGHMYFVVGDQIIIVDRNHRIVAVINV